LAISVHLATAAMTWVLHRTETQRMKSWPCCWLILASLCVACLAGRCSAQSEFPDKKTLLEQLPPPQSLNLENLFKKMDKRTLDAALAALEKQGFTRADIKALLAKPGFMEEVKSLPPNSALVPPEMKNRLQHMSEEQRQSYLDGLKKYVDGNDPNASRAPNSQNKSDIPLMPKPVVVGDAKNKDDWSAQPPVGQDSNVPPVKPNPEALEPQPPPNSALSRGVMSWARRFDPSLTESPALRKAIRELGQHVGENDPRWQKLSASAAAMKERWSKFGESLHLERFAPKRGIPWPQHWKGPSLPGWNLQGNAERVLSAAQGKKLVTAAGGASKSWQGVLAGVVLGLLGVILWNVVLRNARRDDAAQARFKLGPWPVDPASVANREQLVRAFEYLSLLWLGAAARNWNHEMIATQLGQKTKPEGNAAPLLDPVAQQHAAEALAALYERARYAPATEPLPDEALRSARRDLTFLAGLPAS
jgi:hypothetical protein